MTRKNLTLVLATVALAAIATLVIATSMFGGSGGSMNHSMSNGQMMNGEAMEQRPDSGSDKMSGQSMGDDRMQGDKQDSADESLERRFAGNYGRMIGPNPYGPSETKKYDPWVTRNGNPSPRS